MGGAALHAGGVAVQLSGACLMVLMLGWPLAVLEPGADRGAGRVAGRHRRPQALDHLAWNGIVTATLALAIGLATRRWLPRHPFVFILGRGFLVTALATVLAGALGSGVAAAAGQRARLHPARPLADGLGRGLRHRHAGGDLRSLQAEMAGHLVGRALPDRRLMVSAQRAADQDLLHVEVPS